MTADHEPAALIATVTSRRIGNAWQIEAVAEDDERAFEARASGEQWPTVTLALERHLRATIERDRPGTRVVFRYVNGMETP